MVKKFVNILHIQKFSIAFYKPKAVLASGVARSGRFLMNK